MSKARCPHCDRKLNAHPGRAELCKKLELAVSTLRVVHVWATFMDGSELIPEHVARLTDKTLKEIR